MTAPLPQPRQRISRAPPPAPQRTVSEPAPRPQQSVLACDLCLVRHQSLRADLHLRSLPQPSIRYRPYWLFQAAQRRRSAQPSPPCLAHVSSVEGPPVLTVDVVLRRCERRWQRVGRTKERVRLRRGVRPLIRACRDRACHPFVCRDLDSPAVRWDLKQRSFEHRAVGVDPSPPAAPPKRATEDGPVGAYNVAAAGIGGMRNHDSSLTLACRRPERLSRLGYGKTYRLGGRASAEDRPRRVTLRTSGGATPGGPTEELSVTPPDPRPRSACRGSVHGFSMS